MLLMIGFAGLMLLLMVAWGLQQSLQPQPVQLVQPKLNASPFNGQRAYEDLQRIVAFGPRVPASEASAETRAYIRQEFKAEGIEVREYAFEASTPLGPVTMTNIVGIVEGTTDGIVMLGNHYDTKYMPDIDFVGANDGGSTTAWMIEMGRALGKRRQGHSVWLCFFDGEEAYRDWSDDDSLYGSRWMADWLDTEGPKERVRALINVDMIGDCYLGIYGDPGAPEWLSAIVWNQAEALGYGRHFLSIARTIEDDHVPFRRIGVPALNLIDFSYGGSAIEHRRNWHTANDTVEKVCSTSLQAVGDVVYHAILDLDRR